MGTLQHLTDEVHRVLSSPYPVSLKKLYDVTSSTDDSTIQQWADSHPCQVEVLASVVLEALELAPFALAILEKLSLIRDFRNAILLRQPLLLDELLRKAIGAKHVTDRYFSICVALLSAPLPQDVPFPASVPEFFLRALDHAAESPSATTLRPIYSLLSGSCTNLLAILPTQNITCFQEQLIKALKKLENHSVNLLCLGTLATIIRVQKEVLLASSEVSSCTPSSSVSFHAKHLQLEPTQQFFTKKAPKIMHLVMLRVMYACSGSGNLTSLEALESVKLAKVIIGAVEPSVRDSWLNSNAPLARKIHEKILRFDIDPNLRVEALNFVSSLLAGSPIPPEIVCLFQDILCESMCGTSDSVKLEKLSPDVRHKLLTSMDETSTTELLRKTITMATREEFPSPESLNALKAGKSFILTLTDSMQQSSDIRRNIICAVATNGFSALLKGFLELPRVEHRGECPAKSSCPVTCADARRELCFAISTLLVKTTLCSSADNIGTDISLACNLLDKQQDFIVPLSTCKFKYIHQSHSASGLLQIVEQQATQSRQRCSNDWRERLSSDIQKQAASHTELILQTFGEVCRDLEERCESVEQPLLLEKARVKELNLRITELESDATERGHYLSGMELEKSHLEIRAQAAEDNADNLSQRCQELEDQLQQACQRAKDASTSARAEAKRLELEHLASISGKDELLDELANRVKHNEQGAADLRANLELATSTIKLKDSEICGLHTFEEALKTDIEVLKKTLHESNQMTEDLEERHKQIEFSLRCELERVVKVHEIKSLELAKETTRTQLLHQHELHEANEQRQRVEEISEQDRQRFKSKIEEVEQKNAELWSEIKQKEKEFQEVQQLSRRLVAVMGPKKSSESDQKDSKALASNAPTSSVSYGSSTSSQSGSTPKRTRTRNSSRTPSTTHLGVGRSLKTAKAAHDNRNSDSRIPLKDLDNSSCYQTSSLPPCASNIFTAKSRAATHARAPNENPVEVDAFKTDDSSFNDSDLFTSTPKVALHQHTNHTNPDETTADL